MTVARKKNPENWFLSELTVLDTTDNNGNRIVTDQMIDEEREMEWTKTWYSRNTLLALTFSVKWAYYADQMREPAVNEEYQTYLMSLHSKFIQLGIWVSTTRQQYGSFSDILKGSANHRLLRNVRRKSLSLCRCAKTVNLTIIELTIFLMMWKWRTPDRTISCKSFLYSIGMKNIEVVPRLPIEDGIDAVRRMFKSVWIDENNCERGINALTNYHKDYDAKNETYRRQPKARLGIEWSGRLQISMSRLQQSHETKDKQSLMKQTIRNFTKFVKVL